MGDNDWLVERFETHRPHLRAVAYRLLGTRDEADDAVQEAWLRVSRAGGGGVENLGGWLTTVVARVSLTMLRSRTVRREEPVGGRLPDAAARHHDGFDPDGFDPEQQALLADSVGLALLVVLDTLTPTERLAFVLHDMFAMPFEEIAPIVGRSSAAARQSASRARRRVRGAAVPASDLPRQREVVAAFLAASRGGDFDALVALLAADVVLHADPVAVDVGATAEMVGAVAVATAFTGRPPGLRPALVNGAAAAAWAWRERRAVFTFTFTRGKITTIDLIADPARLAQLDLVVLND